MTIATRTQGIRNRLRLALDSRHRRWLAVVIACAVLAITAWTALDWSGYVQTWIGSLARAASGGALGWAVSRYVVGLDLSTIAEDRRPVAALSQAILIAAGAIAVAVGV